MGSERWLLRLPYTAASDRERIISRLILLLLSFLVLSFRFKKLVKDVFLILWRYFLGYPAVQIVPIRLSELPHPKMLI